MRQRYIASSARAFNFQRAFRLTDAHVSVISDHVLNINIHVHSIIYTLQ